MKIRKFMIYTRKISFFSINSNHLYYALMDKSKEPSTLVAQVTVMTKLKKKIFFLVSNFNFFFQVNSAKRQPSFSGSSNGNGTLRPKANPNVNGLGSPKLYPKSLEYESATLKRNSHGQQHIRADLDQDKYYWPRGKPSNTQGKNICTNPETSIRWLTLLIVFLFLFLFT